MFERFTREARAAVVGAQQAARDLGSDRIGSEHLLVALVDGADTPITDALHAAGATAERVGTAVRRRTRGLDPEALASVGIDLAAVRARADEVFGPGALDTATTGPRGHIPFTKEAKKVLEVSLREAIALDQRTLGSGHLLLAVLRLTDSTAHAVLWDLGVDIAELRSDVRRRLLQAA